MARHTKRNEGGRYTAKTGNDWYASIEEENIRKIETEWLLAQVCDEFYAQLADECTADELAERDERAAADADAERAYQAWEEEQRERAEQAAADADAERAYQQWEAQQAA